MKAQPHEYLWLAKQRPANKRQNRILLRNMRDAMIEKAQTVGAAYARA